MRDFKAALSVDPDHVDPEQVASKFARAFGLPVRAVLRPPSAPIT